VIADITGDTFTEVVEPPLSSLAVALVIPPAIALKPASLVVAGLVDPSSRLAVGRQSEGG
jgi:hypothetical protein